MNTNKYFPFIATIFYLVAIALLIAYLNIFIKINYFTNKSIDQELLYKVNEHFSAFIISLFVILFLWVTIRVYIIKFLRKEKKIYTLFAYFFPVFISSFNLIAGFNIIFHAKKLFWPKESFFSWQSKMDFYSSFGKNFFYTPIFIFILIALIYIYYLIEYRTKNQL